MSLNLPRQRDAAAAEKWIDHTPRYEVSTRMGSRATINSDKCSARAGGPGEESALSKSPKVCHAEYTHQTFSWECAGRVLV
jgi:hypothetical protein